MTAADHLPDALEPHRRQSSQENEYRRAMDDYYQASPGAHADKLANFTKYVSRQTLSTFLAKHELFQQILPVHGHIIEGGVFHGGGMMTWAQLSAIYEPFNHLRRVVGFDTFTGFPSVSDQDQSANTAPQVGGLASHAYEDLAESMRLFDLNRPIGHIPRSELVKGDVTETIPAYIERNPHLVVALLYLDFDLYEPTKVALEHFLPRMPKGAVLAFDELCVSGWPGETVAVLEAVGLRNLRIRRFPYASALSYAVLE
jgi:hypothetical protein